MWCEWHALSLVVVNDLYVVGVAFLKIKQMRHRAFSQIPCDQASPGSFRISGFF